MEKDFEITEGIYNLINNCGLTESQFRYLAAKSGSLEDCIKKFDNTLIWLFSHKFNATQIKIILGNYPDFILIENKVLNVPI